MLKGHEQKEDVSFGDIILYLKLFRYSMAPPMELPPLIWGMPLEPGIGTLDFPTLSPTEASGSWDALAIATRIELIRRTLDLGVHPLALSRFVGDRDRSLIGALAPRRRRGRPVAGRQIFRSPARAAHANVFLDVFRLMLFAEPMTARTAMAGFDAAFTAYQDVVDIREGRLDGEDAFAVAMSAVSGELVSIACHQSRCWYYAHRDFARSTAPWLSHGRCPLTIADRVRFFLLCFVPEAERPAFSADDVARARRVMVEGSARWRDGGHAAEK